MLASRIGEAFEKKLEASLDEQLAGLLDAAGRKICDEKIRERVDAIVAKGWAQTDSWGNPTGAPKTFEARVHEWLFAKSGSYSSSKTRIEEIFDEALRDAMLGRPDHRGTRPEGGGILGAIVLDAAKTFRAQVDNLMSAKLQESLRSALGLGK